jgi:hypothetical protein
MNDPLNIEEYTGERMFEKFSPDFAELMHKKLDYIKEAFGENVEYERFFGEILYCPETRDYIYRPADEPVYELGTRPILESAVAEATKGCNTDREKVLGLIAYVRDLKEKSHGYDYFYGGTEEDLIKKGERFCERVARLFCALCEIASIPCRTVHHTIGGHLTNEVYIEGKWGYMDPRFGLFYLSEDGKLASVEEITENPDIIYTQPEWVYEYGSKEYTHEFMRDSNRNIYLSKNEIQLYGNYSLRDKDKYHYGWMPSAQFPMPEREAKYRVYAEVRKAYMKKYFSNI